MNRSAVLTLVVIGIASLSCHRTAHDRQDPPDLQAYVAEVRAHGMTEGARQALSMVAGIRTRVTILEFDKDRVTGSYGESYTSTACPLRGANPEATRQRQTEIEQRVDRDMEGLRKYADSDGSGFVSTAEGMEFRALVTFGLLADHIVKDGGDTASALAHQFRLTPEAATARLAKYDELAKRLNESSEFQLPLVVVRDAEDRSAQSGPGA